VYAASVDTVAGSVESSAPELQADNRSSGAARMAIRWLWFIGVLLEVFYLLEVDG
jgi:hypothetical protein